jgi:hydrogenase maturation protein HypF
MEAIRAGRIVALKGLGGFHLACDATSSESIWELRRRKHRDDKPFAVMVRDIEAAVSFCAVGLDEVRLLSSPARPIVLLPRRATDERIVAEVAPETSRLGLMLPYTPLHHLLMHASDGRPLVMTSGNRSDEPIAIDTGEALSRLAGIADLFVVHDRDIRVRCDDSVVRPVGAAPIVLRRSRGFAPAPVWLSFRCAVPILAVGGQLKNTFALGRDRQAFLSHHIGDLDDLRARDAFERDLALYEEMLAVTPRIVAHDLHPDYASTRIALARPGVVHVGVQHHHAHVAACLTEHRLRDVVIGVAWDGAGWGTDGCVWGGEFLVGQCATALRAARLRYVAMPGGDRAAREPWRMAISHLRDAGVDERPFMSDAATPAVRATICRMIDRGVNAPMTSSAGRLFDAVAAICGARAAMTYEGQAAAWLESLAEPVHDTGRYPFLLDHSSPIVVDTRPLIRAVARDRLAGVAPGVMARRFHHSLADIVGVVCDRLRGSFGPTKVALTGGVFQNGVLLHEAEKRLVGQEFEVYRHRIVPPGDGGLSLGQLAVAAARYGAQQEK